jgi:hypothetical protein
MSLIFELAPANAVLPVFATADHGGAGGEHVTVVGNDIQPPLPKLAVTNIAGVSGNDVPDPPKPK